MDLTGYRKIASTVPISTSTLEAVQIRGCETLVDDVAGVAGGRGFEEDDRSFLFGARAVFEAARDDAELARTKSDDAVAKLDSHFAAPDEEHLVFVVVMVPGELALELYEFHFLSIEFGNDFRPPMLGYERKLFVEGGSEHRLIIPT
jgi:hypothetical protein